MTVPSDLTARQRKQVYMHHADIFNFEQTEHTNHASVYDKAEQQHIYEAIKPTVRVVAVLPSPL